MKTKRVLCRGQTRAIEDAVESWKADHDSALAVRDLEDVVRSCLFVAGLLEGWEKEAWEVLFSEKPTNTQETGHDIRAAQAETVEAFQGVAQRIAKARTCGYEPEGAEKFSATLKALQARQERFAKRWPFITEADVALGMAQIARGEVVSAEELARELLG